MNQRTLFDTPPAPLSLPERAAAWMDENPAVMKLFEDLALDLAGRGEHFGVKGLAEILRRDRRVQTTGQWKINNSFVTYIGRALVKLHPELAEYIEMRKVASEP